MHRVTISIRRGILYIVALVLVAGYPLAAMADAQEPTTTNPETTTPATTETTTTTPTAPPKEEPKLTYTYDAQTEKWNSEKWQFNPQTGAYEPTPKPILIEPEPVKDTTDNSVDKTVDTNVTLNNTITSDATSGNAVISNNTTAGNALSGDATAVANIMNVVNSSIATNGNQKIATFTQDIMGDVKGDIMLYPLILKALLEAEATKDTVPPSSTTINASTNVDVNNTVDLVAKSGDATVDSNTKAGNATSGSATAMANVVNILNSMIAAQNTFIGTINIYGSLEGDILIAPDFIPQLLSSNGDVGSQSDLMLSKQDTTTIVNNITTVAESGAASVFGNTKGGDATSGDASSNVVIFNVSGHEIVAENSMLVFVNVLGKWVGMIVDAPQGATAAMIGTGVTQNTKYAPDVTVNSQSTHGITNTIALSAESGAAVVSNNTTGGNAVSGTAKAMANVANMSGSTVNLTGWMSYLFINIQGDWLGSLGIKTSYGDSVPSSVPVPTGPIQFIPAKEQPAQTNQSNVRFTVIDSRLVNIVESAIEENSTVRAVLANSSTKTASVLETGSKTETPTPEGYDFRLWIVAGSIFIVGASVIGIRRLLQS